MDRKTAILLVPGLLITIIVFFISIYAAGILFVVLIAIVMSLLIMRDSASLPDIVAELREDAKAVIIRNTGNSDAKKIHVALVPLNIEFNLSSLPADATYEYALEKMIGKVKTVVTFENDTGNTFSRSYRLSSGEETFEPFKPMIPLFKWK
jgi:hypothetical protein